MLRPELSCGDLVGAAQRTLRNPIGCVGTGLHTGAKVSLSLRPAEADSGIRVVRYDQPDRTPVAARYDQVCDTTMCTKLGRPGGPTIATMCAPEDAENLAGALPAEGHTKILAIDLDGAVLEG